MRIGRRRVAGTFVYNPPAGTVLNTSQSLSVTFTPTDTADYKTATDRVNIVVNAKIVPTVTWAKPAAITYGTPLSGTQLDATASVPGTFTYTPAAGTIPEGRRPIPSRSIHPDRHRQLQRGDRHDHPDRQPGEADRHLGRAGGCRRGVRAERHPARRRGLWVGRHLRLQPGGGLGAGAGTTQTLSVTFTPTDATDYTTATATTTVTVNPKTTRPSPGPSRPPSPTAPR